MSGKNFDWGWLFLMLMHVVLLVLTFVFIETYSFFKIFLIILFGISIILSSINLFKK